MRAIRKCRVIFAFLAVSLPGVAAAREPPPLEAYGALPGIEDIAISPSGTRIAVTTEASGGRRLMVLDQDMKAILSMGADGLKVRGLSFIGDDMLLAMRSKTVEVSGFVADRYELAQGIVFNLQKPNEIATIYQGNLRISSAVFGNYGVRQDENGKWAGYFGALEYQRSAHGDWIFDHGRPALFKVGFPDGLAGRRAAPSPAEGMERDWLLGPHGAVLATFDIRRANGAWSIRNSSGKEIASGTNPNGDAWLVGLTQDLQGVIYASEDKESGLILRWQVPLSGGTPERFLPDVDVDRLYFSHTTGALLGYSKGDAPADQVFFDTARARAARMALVTFKDRQARLVTWSEDMGKIIVHTTSDHDSGTWWIVDVATRQARDLGYDRPTIEADMIGPVSRVEYTAGDGLALDGILTLPPGREAKGLPLVVLPHGGPHSHDDLGFDWWAQAYASRGYAVFQPNFRGSTGRAEAFARAGYGQWGRAMQTDISDGVAHLAAQGIIDPRRACIVGASYGGYAALAGVTVQQGLYRCAVAVAGVSDIGVMYATDREESDRSGLLVASLREELGPREGWAAVSPRRIAERADAPILLIHGRDDTVVPFEQSRLMADALSDARKPHRLVPLAGEDHWLSLGETRVKMLREAVAFVIEHNPPE